MNLPSTIVLHGVQAGREPLRLSVRGRPRPYWPPPITSTLDEVADLPCKVIYGKWLNQYGHTGLEVAVAHHGGLGIAGDEQYL